MLHIEAGCKDKTIFFRFAMSLENKLQVLLDYWIFIEMANHWFDFSSLQLHILLARLAFWDCKDRGAFLLWEH
ncbi:hypothetical protein DDQ68_09420 [Hymenobacter nivis]|uniref:Uncharacterized protein n=1 Tax=Hymenobacter nivis TaxID=1850093 RepID=A0A2Z3GNZ2_9BACT|nr:hypothetical protein DDQ68_09420 [Hymenobacter nivis]